MPPPPVGGGDPAPDAPASHAERGPRLEAPGRGRATSKTKTHTNRHTRAHTPLNLKGGPVRPSVFGPVKPWRSYPRLPTCHALGGRGLGELEGGAGVDGQQREKGPQSESPSTAPATDKVGGKPPPPKHIHTPIEPM